MMMKEKLLIISVAGLLGAVILIPSIMNNKPAESFIPSQEVQSAYTQEVLPSSYDTGLSWEEAVKLKKPIAVNFYVDWCHYCKKFAPVLDSLRKEYQGRVSFVLIKADEPKNSKLVNEYGISGYPTLYLVNPSNDNRVYLNNAIYGNPELIKREIDRFLRVNKK